VPARDDGPARLGDAFPLIISDRVGPGERLEARRGDLDRLRAQADAGDGDALELAGLLARRGQGEEAERLRRFGLNPDGSIACA
jgi:hypothetical protein